MIQQALEKKMLDAIREALANVAIDISPSQVPGSSRAEALSSPVPPPASGEQPSEARQPKAALPSPLIPIQIFGAWQPASIGYLKNLQEAAAVATIATSIGTQIRTVFTTGERSYSGTIVLRIRAERDVTGEALLKLSEPIDALLTRWQADTYQTAFTALSVPGFRVCEVSFPGGNPQIFDFTSKTVTIDWPFTLTGTDN